MRKYLLTLLTFLLTIGFLSCKKSNPETNNPDNTNTGKANYPNYKNFDVYAVGTKTVGNETFATYWKNGVEKILSNVDSRATSIAFKGSDVYIGGAVNKPTYNRGVYWKNDQMIDIPLPDRPVPFAYGVKSIVVDGNDIYMFGESNQYSKNGITYHFLGYQPIDAMYAKDGRIAQIDHNAGGYYYREVMQTAGTLLPNASTIGAMLLDKNDWYVAGVRVTNINNQGHLTAGYWKNGVFVGAEPINTPDPIIIRGMAINQNGVYVVGIMANQGQLPAYWHDGKITYLPIPQGTYRGAARSIVLNGNDVYIAGDANGRPCYWKNGNLEFFGSEATQGRVNGITLVPR